MAAVRDINKPLIFKTMDELKQFPLNLPFVGVYNVEEHTIALCPCIKNKVMIQEDAAGKFLRGWLIDDIHLSPIEQLKPDVLAEYEKSGYAPRKFENAQGVMFTAHEFLLRLMGEIQNAPKYRGFAVTLTENGPKFEWSSGALNSPRNELGLRIQRGRGTQMEMEHQKEVMELINNPGAAARFKEKATTASGGIFSQSETKKAMADPAVKNAVDALASIIKSKNAADFAGIIVRGDKLEIYSVESTKSKYAIRDDLLTKSLKLNCENVPGRYCFYVKIKDVQDNNFIKEKIEELKKLDSGKDLKATG